MHKTLDGQPDGKRRHSISRHKWEVNVQDERKDVGTIWRWVVSFTPRPLYPGKEPLVPNR